MGIGTVVEQALLATLKRALEQRDTIEADALSRSRRLRVRLALADPPAWTHGAVAILEPRPERSRDARWAAALAARGAASPLVAVPAAAIAAVGYPQVREFAASLVGVLAAAPPAHGRVALPLPGSAHSLDDAACLEYLLLGLVDALSALATLDEANAPAALSDVVLLEPDPRRAAVLADHLDRLLGLRTSRDATPEWALDYPAGSTAAGARAEAPFEQRLTVHDTLVAFVAMPFKPALRDVYVYGIQGPARRSRFKAERLDFEQYTGSVIEQIKQRIETAHLVIADITEPNANVFLEIGYAWGRGRPTVLLRGWPGAPEAAPPTPFDVLAERRIDYTDIGHLDEQLGSCLAALYPQLKRKAQLAD